MQKLFVLLLGMSLSVGAVAQEFRVPSLDEKRKGEWEVTFQLITNESDKIEGGNGSSFKLDSRTGWGFGIARNMSNHFALGFDFGWIRPEYKAVLTSEDPNEPAIIIDHRADIITGQFKGVWNIFKGSFTPYVEAGAGWTHVDTNVADGPPVTGCWWHPVWGPVCQNFYDTHSDTNLSYGGGLGLRWEVGSKLLLKASYNLLIIDDDGRQNNPELNSIKLEIGSRY
jgi:opacity protein-like surface antigen